MSQSNHDNLDRPIWAALTSSHVRLGYGDSQVRRYDPEVAPFAAIASETPENYQALLQLLNATEQVGLLSEARVNEQETPQAKHIGMIHQMIATHHETDTVDATDVMRLGSADSNDMLELAQRMKPGPFGKRTHETGHYIGVRDRGRLVAMAGERMQFDGYVEISAVCVDDEWRGRGVAGRLVRLLQRDIVQRGACPFLHVYSDNVTASALYERLGFELRRSFFVTQVKRDG